MDKGFSAGRVFGIAIRVSWTTLILAALVVLNLATIALPEVIANQPTWLYWSMAVVAMLLFFVCLLAHEIAHSIVAKRQGAKVEVITLWLLGGIATISNDSPTAGDEFRRAVVGPVTSIVLGMGFGLISTLMALLHLPAVAIAVPAWLAMINVLLGIFNLLPVFPLDGGRALRALLWNRRRDEMSATLTAGRIGTAFGYCTIWGGVMYFFFTSNATGIWWAMIGGFVVFACRAEVAAIVEKSTIGKLLVRDVMRPNPKLAPDWITIDSLLDDYMLPSHHAAYPLRDFSGSVSGLITLSRIGRVPAQLRPGTQARSAAAPIEDVVKLQTDEPIIEATGRLATSPDGIALVMDKDSVIGTLTPEDIQFVETAYLLRNRSR